MPGWNAAGECCINLPVQNAIVAVPPAYRPRGVFWWMATLAHELMQPTPKMREMLARAREGAGVQVAQLACLLEHA